MDAYDDGSAFEVHVDIASMATIGRTCTDESGSYPRLCDWAPEWIVNVIHTTQTEWGPAVFWEDCLSYARLRLSMLGIVMGSPVCCDASREIANYINSKWVYSTFVSPCLKFAMNYPSSKTRNKPNSHLMSEPTNEQAIKLNNHPTTNRAKLIPQRTLRRVRGKLLRLRRVHFRGDLLQK
jgi:hypothetical protein